MADVVSKREKLETTLMKLAGIGAGAVVSDRFLANFIGNGNLVSGLVKLASGFLVAKATEGLPEYVAIGVAVDGVMDLAQALLGRFANRDVGGVI